METAKTYCDERDLPQEALIDARLGPDMLPLGYR